MLSTGTQYVTLQKYFSHPSLVIYFFSNPTHKTKTGTSNRWETTTQLVQSNYVSNQQQVLGFAVTFGSLSIHCTNAVPQTSY
jgi:hypothetical protein